MAKRKDGYALHVQMEYVEEDGSVKVSDNDFNAYGFPDGLQRDVWAKGLRDVVGHYALLSSIGKTGAFGQDPSEVTKAIVNMMCQFPKQPGQPQK